jgi:hypothetical protein
MKNLKRILLKKEVDLLIENNQAKYIHWGEKRNQILFVGDAIYYNHTSDCYHYLGKRDQEEKK